MTTIKKLLNTSAKFIIRKQQEDGAWNIFWSWGVYANEWVIYTKWWQGNDILVNMLYLKGEGELYSTTSQNKHFTSLQPCIFIDKYYTKRNITVTNER